MTQLCFPLRWHTSYDGEDKKGCKGNNMSCDLCLEHMNKLLKQSLHSVSPTFKQDGANAISRIANSINSCEAILDNFDDNFEVHVSYGCHSKRSMLADLQLIISKLHSKGVYQFRPRRKYVSCNHENTIYELFQTDKFYQWIDRLKLKYNNMYDIN